MYTRFSDADPGTVFRFGAAAHGGWGVDIRDLLARDISLDSCFIKISGDCDLIGRAAPILFRGSRIVVDYARSIDVFWFCRITPHLVHVDEVKDAA